MSFSLYNLKGYIFIIEFKNGNFFNPSLNLELN